MEEDQCKIAFVVTPFGLYEFIRMPFGLQGGSSNFPTYNRQTIRRCHTFSNAYIDDLIILVIRG